MKSTAYKVLQAYLWLVCAFHVLVGAGIALASGIPETMAGFYGARVDWTPQFIYILKPLGAFMLVLGLLAGAAARKPLGYRAVVYGFVTLFAIRSLQRIVHRQEILDAFAIAPARNLGNMVLFAVMAISLLLLFRHVARNSPAAA